MSDLGSELTEDLSRGLTNVLTSSSNSSSSTSLSDVTASQRNSTHFFDPEDEKELSLESDSFLNDDIEKLFDDSSTPTCHPLLHTTFFESLNVDLFECLVVTANVIFLIFLVLRLGRAKQGLQSIHASVVAILYFLILSTLVVGVTRSVVSIVLSNTFMEEVVWWLLRFHLLLLELAVLVLGLWLQPQPDVGRVFVRRLLLVALVLLVLLALLQTTVNGLWPSRPLGSPASDVLGTGDPLMDLLITMVFVSLYLVVIILPHLSPFLPCSLSSTLGMVAQKRTFYLYLIPMAVIKTIHMSGLLIAVSTNRWFKYCSVNLNDLFFLACFPIVIYTTFMHTFLHVKPDHSLLFTYQPQEDDGDVYASGRAGAESGSAPILLNSAFNTANGVQEENNVDNDRLVSVVNAD